MQPESLPDFCHEGVRRGRELQCAQGLDVLKEEQVCVCVCACVCVRERDESGFADAHTSLI